LTHEETRHPDNILRIIRMSYHRVQGPVGLYVFVLSFVT